MVLNYIWIGFFLVAFVMAAGQLIFNGNTEVFPGIMSGMMDAAKNGFEISLGLTGVLALWMGIMKIGEKGGLVDLLARALSPVFTRLFPDIPKGHPVFGHIFMNISANMLGLDNAATPLGLKAMEGMQELNQKKDTASNPMIMFLVLNTSGLTLIPVSILAYRAGIIQQQGLNIQPTDIFIPILIATLIATLAGIVITALYQKINLKDRVLLATMAGLTALIGGIIYLSTRVDSETMNLWSTSIANIMLFGIIVLFLVRGMVKKVNVYEAFIEGAKDGFQTAVRIIPYLVAILVAIAAFRASGAMTIVLDGLCRLIEALGVNADFVNALPTAIMKPLSGSGARGMMLDAMNTYGADSFVGRLSCIFQGATDTTFYILAVYFGAVGVKNTRHAVKAGLLTDLVGVLAAIGVAYLFFN